MDLENLEEDLCLWKSIANRTKVSNKPVNLLKEDEQIIKCKFHCDGHDITCTNYQIVKRNKLITQKTYKP